MVYETRQNSYILQQKTLENVQHFSLTHYKWYKHTQKEEEAEKEETEKAGERGSKRELGSRVMSTSANNIIMFTCVCMFIYIYEFIYIYMGVCTCDPLKIFGNFFLSVILISLHSI